MSNRRLAIIMIFVIAVIVAAALQWEVPREDTQTARVASSTGALQARAGVDANRLDCPAVAPCRPLKIWFVFQNLSSQAITDLEIVDFQAPGFAYDRRLSNITELFFKASLAAQASTTVTATLQPETGSGRYNITAIYQWTNPAGGKLRGSITVGPVEISSWWRRPIFNVARRVKDLALPLALALAGWWLQREQKKRDDLQVVLTTLLPTHVKDTKKYYLPFAARTNALIQRIQLVAIARQPDAAGNIPTPVEQRIADLRCAHAFFSLLKQHRFIVRGIGGVQFKNHDGERIVKFATRFLMTESTEYRIPQELQDMVLAQFALGEDFGQFLSKVDKEPYFRSDVLVEGVERVVQWIRDPAEPLSKMTPILTILQEVLLYEMDIPMELWYREPREFPLEELKEARTKLTTLATRDATDAVVRKPRVEENLKKLAGDLEKGLGAYMNKKRSRIVTL